MSQQSFIYNSSSLTGANVNNPFNVEKSALIRAAGLTEEVTVYFAVGGCSNCGPNDLIWEPVMVCGSPLILSPDNNMIVIEVPGKYSLGDPFTPLALVGDVNITKEEGVHQYQLPKSCPLPECEVLTVRGLTNAW